MSDHTYTTTGRISSRARRRLDQLHDHVLNFELEGLEPTAQSGWTIDDWCQPLPPERPGAPAPDGSWAAAKRLMEAYEFADPEIVTAIYHGDRPLEERDMVLQGRFHGLKFLMGLRVGGVRDEEVTVDGRRATVWGWNYRTLQGHLEMGQMDYEVWKWADTGEVEFRIHAFSRRASIRNPIVRLGMLVFGRMMQKRFARHALRRMNRLVELVLIAQSTGVVPPEAEAVTDHIDVRPAREAGVEMPEQQAAAGQ